MIDSSGAAMTLSAAPLVIVTYLPGETPFTSGRYETRQVLCDTDTAYGEALSEAWLSDRVIVNVEHDLEVSDEILQGLIDCPRNLCAQTYLVYEVSGIHDAPAYPYCANPGPWVTEGEPFAAFAAPGFIKVRPAARVNPLPVKHWMGVEAAVHASKIGDWHLHWPPVEHYHR